MHEQGVKHVGKCRNKVGHKYDKYRKHVWNNVGKMQEQCRKQVGQCMKNMKNVWTHLEQRMTNT